MPLTANRAKETTTSTGTGAITLAGAVSGYVTLASVAAISASLYYCIDGDIGEFEVGIGHLSASTTLVRDTVLASSNAGALVSFSAGTKNVFITAPAESLVPYRGAGTFASMLALASTTTGDEYVVTDVGPCRSRWYYNGTLWRPVGGRVLLRNLPAAVVGAAQTAEQILDAVAIPANLFGKTGDVLYMSYGLEKSAATEGLTLRLRVGTAGTTADTLLLSVGSLTTNRSYGANKAFAQSGASSFSPMGIVLGSGATSGGTSYTGSTGGSQAAAVALATSLITTAQTLSVSLSLSVGAETPKLQSFIAEFIAA